MIYTVYSKNGCPFCTKVKNVLELSDQKHVVYMLDRDFTKQEFYEKFGEGSTFPQVICDDNILGGSNSSDNNKSSSSSINKHNNHGVNRGIELMLNGGKRKQTYPFHIIFEKMVCFLNREVTIYFEFSLRTRKRIVVSRGKRNVSS